MKTLQLLFLCLVLSLVTGCDRNKPVPAIPERKSNFQKTVFTQPQSGSTITLVSETECEIDNRGNILLAEYSRQDNRLRVVIRAGGAASVSYFDLMPDGLRADGQVFLLPEPLSRVRDQMRIAREADEARQRAAQMEQERQRRLEEDRKQERQKAIIAKRDSVMRDVRTFLSNGSKLKGTLFSRWSYNHKDPSLPFEVTISDNLTVEDNAERKESFSQSFKVPAHFKWLKDIEPICRSNWGNDIREYDGMFFGSISVDPEANPPEAVATMNYFVHDKSLNGDWNSAGDNTRWDGTAFHGKGDGVINLVKP